MQGSDAGKDYTLRPMTLPFKQIDVFTREPFKGNPLAVVLGADRLTSEAMQSIAHWTNLSETTFLLAPTTEDADYRVRIFTPKSELPFAGHPTLGTCHAWLAAGGVPRRAEIVQECGIGLVRIERESGRLAFEAPPLRRCSRLSSELLKSIADALRIAPGAIRAAQLLDNGPTWTAIMLNSRAEVLALEPDFAAIGDLKLGVIGAWQVGEAQFEVRAFAPALGISEDPVTGSLNAGLARWLIGSDLAPSNYVVSQGTVLGRAGSVHITSAKGTIWVGGDTITCIEGTIAV